MKRKHVMMLIVLAASGGLGQTCPTGGFSSVALDCTLTLTASPNPVCVNQPVTISATVDGGVPPYSFRYSYWTDAKDSPEVFHGLLGTNTDSLTINPTVVGAIEVTVLAYDGLGTADEEQITIEVQDQTDECSDGDSDSAGGICGQYSNTDGIVIYGSYDVYQGQLVETSTAKVSVGQYVGYQADGFYDFLVHTTENTEITWDVDGSAAALVSSTVNQATIHALTIGEVTLCVLGTDKDTGQLVGYRSVPITIDSPSFRISGVELSSTNADDSATFIAHIEGEPTAPYTLTVEAVGSSCPEDATDLPCYVGSLTYGSTYEGQLFIGVGLDGKCSSAGGGIVYLRFYLQDATNMYTVPVEYEYSCSG